MSTPEGTRRPKAKKNVTVTVSTEAKPKRSRSRSRSRNRTNGAGPVVKVVGTSTRAVTYQKGASNRQRRRLQRLSERHLQKEINNLKKRTKGPPVADLHTVTLTLGTLTGVAENDLSRQLRYPLSPVLLKLEDAGKALTPLSERAHQYNLWKLLHLSVHMIPLVNGSNISGTLALVDIDQDGGSVKPDTVDTIKARCHAEAHIGQRVIFTPPPKQLWGPRQGWWLVDTNEDSAESFGPALNFWTYLQTQNLLHISGVAGNAADETTVYKGPLWLVELRAKYGFANYEPKPALAVLGTTNATVSDAKFTTGENGELVIEAQSSKLVAFVGKSDNRRVKSVSRATAAGGNLSNVLYSMADDAVKKIAPALGPWGWLARAGWWVARQILPGADTEEDAAKFRAVVYPSVKAAQDNEPVYVTDLANSGKNEVSIPTTQFKIQQLNSPNLNTANPDNDVLATAIGQEEQAYPLNSVNRFTRPPQIGVWLPARELWAAMGLPKVHRFFEIHDHASSTAINSADHAHFYFQMDVFLNAQNGVHRFSMKPFYNPFYTTELYITHEIYTWWPVACTFDLKDPKTRLCFMKTGETDTVKSAIFADLRSICQSLKQTKDDVYAGFGKIASFTRAYVINSEKEIVTNPDDISESYKAYLWKFFPLTDEWKTWRDFFRSGLRPDAYSHIWYAMGRQDFSIGHDHHEPPGQLAYNSSYRGIPVHLFVSPDTGQALAITWMQYYRPDGHFPETKLRGYTGQPLAWTLLWTKDPQTLNTSPAVYGSVGPELSAEWTEEDTELDSLLEELEVLTDKDIDQPDLSVKTKLETPLVKADVNLKSTSQEELLFWKNLAQQLLKQETSD
nr:MAG: capsid protein precursor [Astroviridae sp.]